jgi:hypothetical protein
MSVTSRLECQTDQSVYVDTAGRMVEAIDREPDADDVVS